MSNNEITTQSQPLVKPRAIDALASNLKMNPEELHNTLVNTVFKGAKEHELAALLMVANEYGLNPLVKEIYAFPGKGGSITPIVGVDGWISIMNRQEILDGYNVEVFPEKGEPTHATITIHIKGRSHPVKATEYFDECFRPTEPWKKMPRRMMRNKVISQGARMAFGISGIYDEDEANDSMRNATPKDKVVLREVDLEEAPKPIEVEVETEAPKAEPKAKALSKTAPSEKIIEEIEVKVIDIDFGEGNTNGKDWKRWRVNMEAQGQAVQATTFSSTVGDKAEFLIGLVAIAKIEKTPKGLSLIEINEKEAV